MTARVTVCPIVREHEPFAGEIVVRLAAVGVDAVLETSDTKIGRRIKNAKRGGCPFIVVVAGCELDEVGIHFLDGTVERHVSVETLVRLAVLDVNLGVMS